MVSVALFVLSQQIVVKDRKNRIKKTCITITMSLSLIISVTLMMYQGYKRVISPNIIAYNKEHGIYSQDEAPIIVSPKFIELSVRAANTPNNNVTVMEVTQDAVFEDSSNNTFNADELIDKTICTFYKGQNGDVCIFLGQYDSNYCWNGSCVICAYKDGRLYYSTEDEYVHGNIKSYTRASKSTSSERWLITKKKVLDNNLTIGDTKSYGYHDIDSRINDIDIYNGTVSYIPKISDIYTIEELYEMLTPNLIKHYYGMYDENGNWEDTTGNAYSIEYDNGVIKSILKGVFIDNSFMSGHQYDLTSDEAVTHTYGRFRVKPNGDVLDSSNWDEEILTMEQFSIILNEEQFKDEVLPQLTLNKG